jgi:lysozyme
MFGGGTFKNLDRHPDQVNHGGGYSSAAAGAYQFIPATWGGVVSALRLNSFSPSNQDQGAIHLVKMRGALSAIDKGELSRQAVNLLAPEWASFPTTWGGSYYGQPSKTYGELDRFYRKRFIEYTSMPSSVAIEKTKETPVVLSSAPVSQVDPLKDFLKFLDLI